MRTLALAIGYQVAGLVAVFHAIDNHSLAIARFADSPSLQTLTFQIPALLTTGLAIGLFLVAHAYRTKTDNEFEDGFEEQWRRWANSAVGLYVLVMLVTPKCISLAVSIAGWPQFEYYRKGWFLMLIEVIVFGLIALRLMSTAIPMSELLMEEQHEKS